MSPLRLRLLAFVASICLLLAVFNAPRPEGFLDQIVWPVAYALSAALSALVALKPNKFFLNGWGAVIISTQAIRSIALAVDPTIPAFRTASVALNVFFGILAYFVWVGWVDQVPPYADEED